MAPDLLMFLLAGLSLSLQHAYDHVNIVNDNHSLEYYLCQNGLNVERNVQILKVPAGVNHTISPGLFCLLENLTNVTIMSDSLPQQAMIVCQQPWRGFGFFNTSHLRLSGLTFHQCGGEIKFIGHNTAEKYTNHSHIYLGAYQKAVLMFSHCHYTSLSSVSMESYGGIGILMVNAFGKTYITNLYISNNRVCSNPHSHGLTPNYNFTCGGSGIVFMYIGKRGSNEPHLVYVGGHTKLYDNNNVYNSTSSYNYLINNEISDFNQPVVTGSALTIILATKTDRVHFVFTDVVEISRNYGEAAIFIEYCNSVNHSITFKNLIQTKNNGSTDISSVFFVLHHVYRQIGLNLLHIKDSYFSNNSNIHPHSKGGVMYVKAVHFSSAKFKLYISNTTYHQNRVVFSGSCFYIKFENNDALHGFIYVKLTNVTVTNHSQEVVYLNPEDKIAVFSFINVYKVEINNCTFSHNSGSVIEAYGSVIQLVGNNTFTDNTAVHGGAFSLSALSRLSLHDQYSIFQYNTAQTFGGAIYIDDSAKDNSCGIEINGHINSFKSNYSAIRIVFSNNSAKYAGSDIFSSSLYNCTMYMDKSKHLVNPDSIPLYYLKIFHAVHKPLDLSSLPATICPCQWFSNETDRCKYQDRCNKWHQYPYPSQPYPGQIIEISVMAIDAVGKLTYTNVFVQITPLYANEPLNIKLVGHTEEIYPLYRNCNTLNFTLAVAKPKMHKLMLAGNLHLATANQIYLNVNITMSQCPIGFAISDAGVCDCSPLLTGLHDNSITCDINTLTITLPPLSWFGKLSEDGVEGFSSVCHINYCCTQCTFNATVPDTMCRYNRTGVLCGQCPAHMSLTFGSDECAPLCSNYWLFTIMGYGIVGVVLVVVLFKLQLTISTGLLGGVIFFVNMAEVNEHNLCLDNSLNPLTVFMSLLNLNLGFPLCFYSDMSMLAKIGLQFVFPVYLWLMVILMVVVSRYSTRVSNLIANQSVQVLVTLVQLSFAKVLSTVTSIFVSANIRVSNTSNPIQSVWYYDGNIRYLGGPHLVLFILCIIISVVFILPYLAFSCVASWLLRFRKTHHIRPLIDAHHGPYKDNVGYWFGVRQLILALAYGLYAGLRGTRPLLLLSLQIISLMVFCVMQSHIRPFKNVLVGIVDVWLLVLLLSLNVATYMFIAAEGNPQWGSPYIMAILGLFLVTVVCILVYHVAMIIQCSRQLLVHLELKFDGYKSFSGYREPLLETT